MNNSYDAEFYYLALMVPAMIISIFAQIRVQSAYSKYQRQAMRMPMSGHEAASRILAANGIHDVHIEQTGRKLGDHYDPTSKTLRLSPDVMNKQSVASVAIAAHECGHALQHHDAYAFLQLRSALVSYANFGNSLSYAFIMLGMLFSIQGLMLIGVLFFCAVVAFQLITLPVEYNASARAKKELVRIGAVSGGEDKGISNMLSAAALTYLAAAITAIAQLARLLAMSNNRKARR
ncbi:MAG: zinc metallopeptidase [Eubacteriaceae bacterium]|nr:zinc metallopeptidase [Eubacteriaceae bacterium]